MWMYSMWNFIRLGDDMMTSLDKLYQSVPAWLFGTLETASYNVPKPITKAQGIRLDNYMLGFFEILQISASPSYFSGIHRFYIIDSVQLDIYTGICGAYYFMRSCFWNISKVLSSNSWKNHHFYQASKRNLLFYCSFLETIFYFFFCLIELNRKEEDGRVIVGSFS